MGIRVLDPKASLAPDGFLLPRLMIEDMMNSPTNKGDWWKFLRGENSFFVEFIHHVDGSYEIALIASAHSVLARLREKFPSSIRLLHLSANELYNFVQKDQEGIGVGNLASTVERLEPVLLHTIGTGRGQCCCHHQVTTVLPASTELPSRLLGTYTGLYICKYLLIYLSWNIPI